MLTYALAVSIVISALVTIRAAYSPARRRWFYVFKPLTTILILLAAVLTPSFGSSSSAIMIAAGLGFSLAGDIFLMLPDKYFIWGLGSFLVAHLCYIPAFISRSGFRESLWISLPFVVAALAVVSLVTSRAGAMRWPATVYGLVIMVMAWRACAAWAILGSFPALLALAGALLFVASDTLLATNRFIRQFRLSQAAVLGTYYAGQALIAASLWPISVAAFLEP